MWLIFVFWGISCLIAHFCFKDEEMWPESIMADEADFWLADAPSIQINPLYVEDLMEIMQAVQEAEL